MHESRALFLVYFTVLYYSRWQEVELDKHFFFLSKKSNGKFAHHMVQCKTYSTLSNSSHYSRGKYSKDCTDVAELHVLVFIPINGCVNRQQIFGAPHKTKLQDFQLDSCFRSGQAAVEQLKPTKN